MAMITAILSLLALGTAVLHLWAEYRGPQWLTYAAKPATTVLIVLVALTAPTVISPLYYWLIVIGLLFGLAGDIFLMLPRDRFIAGLVSFLINHLFYIVAFGSRIALPGWSVAGVGVVLYALLIYGLLYRHLGALQIPVIVYMVTIATMAWFGLALAGQQPGVWTLTAGVGSVLFVVSDSALALNRFRKPFAAAELIVLSTYYLAQWLIALSVRG
jgi:uncharacterized membrane protein YhhN